MTLAYSTRQLDREGRAEKTRTFLHGLLVEPGKEEEDGWMDGWWAKK